MHDRAKVALGTTGHNAGLSRVVVEVYGRDAPRTAMRNGP